MQLQHPLIVRDLHDALRRNFGYDDFRPGQLQIIERMLDGKDTLVIMPTGGGKSLCYQLPALVSEGLTIVVSPLIALMRDQVMALRANGVAAAAVNSSVSPEELRRTREAIAEGTLKLLYVSPEKVTTTSFIDYLLKQNVALLAIDEAHCVSIWGNDFRPEYAALYKVVQALEDVPVIALTATADRVTQQDILKQLKLRNPETFISSFERKNIFIRMSNGQRRFEQIMRFLDQRAGEAGIIYCLSRRSTEEMAARLQKHGLKAAFYHAEVAADERRHVQDAFQKDELQIVCATIAFGMGIDKANIRWVIHYNMPKNIESFYQEIGRAGRDGESSESLMFHSFRDIAVFRDFIDRSEAIADFKDVQRQKLERMWELAQATSCRTNVILNYFGEYRNSGCGHCDNCQDPPRGFDGTVLAQKALSACKRTYERVGLHMLVDILRGSGRQEIRALGFDRIKTFGAGRDLPRFEWVEYLTQMLNLGLLEIDYTEGSRLRVTPLGEEVLRGGQTVSLHQKTFVPKDSRPAVSRVTQFEDALLEELKACRKKLAAAQGVPAYVIFPDRTLREIAAAKPVTPLDFIGIHGVGEFKAQKYGNVFMQVVRQFTLNQSHLKRPRGKTYLETLELLQQGLDIGSVASKRSLNTTTIYGHLVWLHEHGEDIDLMTYLGAENFRMIRQAWIDAGKPDQLTPVKERLPESVDFGQIRMALALVNGDEQS